ncbi:NADH:flavin oxidoreductase/NADH oxidase [Crucibulum laeve]|uniref:NADH:flavin oxidoreductase/NADH oxidase n=1 Tax=Crucibulum laeve TaxID=68775 RepID=A0A5C3LWP2_9AGAR|nr:NADH:flavin oxidoreductase/NADH oxidase [Crucibulum laeve]
MSPPNPTPKLFQPIKIGNITLQHRVVLAPLTRFRAAKKSHIHTVSLAKTYYSQRASTPGTLLITEATFIAARAGGYDNVPGIWSDEQIEAWKEVVDGVHAAGSYIYLQLWAHGRAAQEPILTEDGLSYVAPSPIPLSTTPKTIPRELTHDELQEYVQLYAQAAKNAVYRAGFDGVEINSVNGFLLDQFLQDVSNKRTDSYGGSVENRSRFGLQVVDAVVEAVGAEKVGFRLSPWSEFQDMKMDDPIPQFSHFVSSIKESHPNFSYIHVVEPRIDGVEGHRQSDGYFNDTGKESNDFIRKIWLPRPLITAGGYTRTNALKRAEESQGELIAFGRDFIANPDLPLRMKHNIPLNPYDRNTFYTPAEQERSEKGYIDYPFADLEKRKAKK